jgi:hypothetical protein
MCNEEVRIYPLGEPIPTGDTIFVGTSLAAREFLQGRSPDDRAQMAVWTLGHIFTPDQFEAEQPGHEHDPVAASAADLHADKIQDPEHRLTRSQP